MVEEIIDIEVANLPAVVKKNERVVRASFWRKMRRVAGRIPFADDVVAAYFCAVDPSTPTRVRAVLLAALAYFIMPADLIPDIITGLGFTDDATVIATTLGIVSGHVKRRHRAKARSFLDLPNLPDDDI